MLVLSRKSGETVMIGEDIFVTVGQIRAEWARVIICGPAAVMETISGKVLEQRKNAATVQLALNEALGLGAGMTITLVDIRPDRVRLGINSPSELPVHRKEVYDAIRRQNEAAG